MRNKEFRYHVINDCEGCRTYRDSETVDLSACKFTPTYINHWCPCIECLIKSMCNAPCKVWGKYMDGLIEFWEEYE